MQVEQSIQRQILDFLRWRGVPCYKHQNAGIYREGRYIPSHTRGVSDIIGVIPPLGRYLAIEVKRPGGKPTLEQSQFIDTINQAGGLAFVAHSVEEVQEKLNDALRNQTNRARGGEALAGRIAA